MSIQNQKRCRHLQILRQSSGSALQSCREQCGDCLAFGFKRNSAQNSHSENHPLGSFIPWKNEVMALPRESCSRREPFLGAASHPGSGSRKEMQKMLRISFGDKSCARAPSLGVWLACSHQALPCFPTSCLFCQALATAVVLAYPVFFSVPPPCCRMRDCGSLLSDVQAAAPKEAGQVQGTALLFDPEPSFQSTFPLACTVLLTLNVMNMGLVIKSSH